MRKLWLAGMAATWMACALASPARADPKGPGELFRDPVLAFEHLPTRYGGLGSDTDFINMYGNPSWQQLADDVMLGTSALISQASFWGFYDQDNPPATEMMRLRFYAPRPADGLPGDVLYEESFVNPTRTATGYRVSTGVGPYEYLYDVSLTTPFTLAANTTYWVEFLQMGDRSTHYRWEDGYSLPGDHVAGRNAAYPNWALSTTRRNTAFQLWAVSSRSLTCS